MVQNIAEFRNSKNGDISGSRNSKNVEYLTCFKFNWNGCLITCQNKMIHDGLKSEVDFVGLVLNFGFSHPQDYLGHFK